MNPLDQTRSLIETCLTDELASAENYLIACNGEQIVAEVSRSAIGRGGRIRPLLCCCGYAAAGGVGGLTDPRIVKTAASLELLHTFAILHDDVMDGSEMRRGAPSLHRRIADERSGVDPAEAERHGISVAILAGDLALVLSDRMFATAGFAPEQVVAAAAPLARMRLDAVAGQYLDLNHSGPLADPDPALAMTIARLKTGSYSVEGPLKVGATLAGATPAALDALGRFAGPVGEAFQLTDDLMGLYGNPAVTGKDAENDLRRGKPTPLIAETLSMASPDQESIVRAIWGNPAASVDELARLREAVRASGAVGSMSRKIHDLVGAASQSLENPQASDLHRPATDLLIGMAEKIAGRADRVIEDYERRR